MTKQRLEHPTIGTVEVRVSQRAARISIKVTQSGDVQLIIPVGGDSRRAIAFMESRAEWITKARERLQRRSERVRNTCQSAVNSETTPEQIIKYKQAAHTYLPERVDHLCRATGLRCRELKIGRAMSRWGSCSSENVINLTIFIMALPHHLIDFIIIHELCHTVHHNHSPKFHALVDHHTNGREKMLNKELNSWRIK